MPATAKITTFLVGEVENSSLQAISQFLNGNFSIIICIIFFKGSSYFVSRSNWIFQLTDLFICRRNYNSSKFRKADVAIIVNISNSKDSISSPSESLPIDFAPPLSSWIEISSSPLASNFLNACFIHAISFKAFLNFVIPSAATGYYADTNSVLAACLDPFFSATFFVAGSFSSLLLSLSDDSSFLAVYCTTAFYWMLYLQDLICCYQHL